MFNFNRRIQNNRLNSIPQIERLEPERISKQLIEYKPRGIRGIPERFHPSHRRMERMERSEH
jgi:hypothetical protein